MELSAGGSHACARLSDGSVRCWGGNGSGQLGDGTTSPRSAAADVPGLASVVSISAGPSSTCAVLGDGTARCWGDNSEGKLGDGTTTTPRTSPVVVSGLSSAVSIHAGILSSSALLSDGAARAWGYNGTDHRLGDGATTPTPVPLPIGVTGTIAKLAPGVYGGCALRTGGVVSCWGSNAWLGLGTSAVTASEPMDVPGIAGATDIGFNDFARCAVLGGGAVSCWGDNHSGQGGAGTTDIQYEPKAVTGLTNAAHVVFTGNGQSACALRTDGTVWCWGAGGDGELGDGMFATRSTAAPATITDVVELVPAFTAWYARRTDGSVWAWGRNERNQLADGTFDNRATPAPIAGLTNIVELVTNADGIDPIACARAKNGDVSCWSYGIPELVSKTPKLVAGL